MKRLQYLAVILIAAATFTACEGPMGPMGPEGPTRELINKTIQVGVNDWKLVGAADEVGSYYQAAYDNVVPSDVFDKGVIVVYLAQKDGNVNTFTPLPYTFYGIDTDQNGYEYPYSILYTYDVGSDGSLAFKMYVSDYYTASTKPSAQTFYVTML
jgi:hypothetical protein